MSDIMSLGFRPSRLSDLIGQKTLAAAIAKQMETRPPRAILLHGGTGCGKTTVARIIALSLQCKHQKAWGEPCDVCIANAAMFAIHEVNASQTNGVEAIGDVAEMTRYRPLPPSTRKVVILDEAQMMSAQAQNLLLKFFEDAPEHMVWIICTTAPTKILATLKRRCITYHVKGLGFDDRKRLLIRAAKRSGITRPVTPLVEAVNEAHISSPALLLMALEKYGAGESAKEAAAGTDATSVNTLAICKAVGNSSWPALREAMMSATAEEARFIRASVLGYLRGMLVRETNPTRARKIASRIRDLAGIAPLEDAILLQWLWGTLCAMVLSAKSEG